MEAHLEMNIFVEIALFDALLVVVVLAFIRRSSDKVGYILILTNF